MTGCSMAAETMPVFWLTANCCPKTKLSCPSRGKRLGLFAPKPCQTRPAQCKIMSTDSFYAAVDMKTLEGPTMIKALLWDLDNTLLDFPTAEREALRGGLCHFRPGALPR